MPFKITLTQTAHNQIQALERDPDDQDRKKLRKVRKCLALLQDNPRRPGLRTHEYRSLRGEQGQKVCEAYVDNRTTGAWRVFWHYGPNPDEITIIAITPHP